MALTPVQNLQLHNQIERVLHVPGNYRGGILEMTIVIDCAYDKERVQTLCADIVTSCKKQSEVFRNIRLNVVTWRSENILTETVAAAYLQMGTWFEHYQEEQGEQKPLETILAYLKEFHARSKLILLLTPNADVVHTIQDKEAALVALNPFLKQKLILITPEEMETFYKNFIRKFI